MERSVSANARGFRAIFWLLGLLLVGGAGPLRAAWENLPLEGGEIFTVAFDPSNPDRALAGTTAGHLYRSDDGGSTWRPAGAPVPFPGWVVGNLLFDPDRPGRLWVGLWGVLGGGLVVTSDDLGVSWQVRSRGLEGAGQVYALARPPGRPDRILAGTRFGVYRSLDGGETWSKVSSAMPGLEMVGSLFVEGSQPDRILAGTWRRAFRSDDGGSTWYGVFEGMVLDTEVYALRPVLGGSPDEVWAATCGWVYQSPDFGRTWKRWQGGLLERRVRGLALPQPGTILAGTIAGLYRSVDGGRNFRPIGPPGLPVLSVAVHPSRPARILVGTEGRGVWRSEDGGDSFREASSGVRNVRVGDLVEREGELWMAVLHAGAASGLYRGQPPRGPFVFDPGSPVAERLVSHQGVLHAMSGGAVLRRTSSGWEAATRLPQGEEARQLLAKGDRLLVLGRSKLYEYLGERWLERPLGIQPERIALDRQALWFLAGNRLFRAVPGALEQEVGLVPEGKVASLHGLREGVVSAGEAGALRWFGDRPASLTEETVRSIPVEQRENWVLLAEPGALSIFDGDRKRRDPLPLPPFPPRYLSSALVLDGHLYVGTTGFGLWRYTPSESASVFGSESQSDSSKRK